MRTRLPLIVAALIACLAVGAVAASANGTKVGTTIKIKYKGAAPNDPYGTSYFSGKVGPRKCADDRVVKIKGVGKERTDETGRFRLTLSGPAEPGRYKVKVKAAKERRFTCRKAKAKLRIKKGG